MIDKINFDELLSAFIADARLDAVVLDQIVTAGGHSFGLSGIEHEHFVRRVLDGLLRAGMVVVSQAQPGGACEWVLNEAYQLPIGEAIDRLVHDWKTSKDGYAYFAWFTDPANLKLTK